LFTERAPRRRDPLHDARIQEVVDDIWCHPPIRQERADHRTEFATEADRQHRETYERVEREQEEQERQRRDAAREARIQRELDDIENNPL
jgi:hypothetical protein